MHKIIQFILSTFFNVYTKRLHSFKLNSINHFCPSLFKFIESLTTEGAVGAGQHPNRTFDVMKLLKKYKPHIIQELGSGLTTGVFAAYCQKYDAKLYSYEENDKWHSVTKKSLTANNLYSQSIRYLCLDVIETDEGTNFSIPIQRGADFIYVDGPYCKKHNGDRFPNMDIVNYIRDGGRPKIIVVDGRWKSVYKLLGEETIQGQYDFVPNAFSALSNFKYSYFLKLMHHNVFVRKYD